MTVSTSTAVKSPLFSRLGVVGLVVIMIASFFASQLIGLYAAAKVVLPEASQLSVGELFTQGGAQGTVVSLSVLLCFILLTLLTYVIVARKVNSSRQLFEYLGLRHISGRQFLQGASLLTVFIIINEVLSELLQRTPLDFVDPLFASTDAKWLLIVVIVVVAPIYEELVFRGLIWSAIAEQFDRKRGIIIASIISSILFAAIHTQYDLFEMGAIFILALIFCYVRVKANSLLLPMLLHIMNNGVAMALYLTMGSGA